MTEWITSGGQRWEPIPNKQINVLKALIIGLKARFPTLKYLSGHEEAQPEKDDPGPAFDKHFNTLLRGTGLKSRGPAPTKNRKV